MKIGKLYIHPSLGLYLIFFIMLGNLKNFLLAFFFVTLHELAHILTAAAFSAKLYSLNFMPIGQSAHIKGLYTLPIFKKLMIYLSGPLTSVAIGVTMLLIAGKSETFAYLGQINLLIGLFNIMPIFPLDGGGIALLAVGRFSGTLNAASALIFAGKISSVFILCLGLLQLILFPFNISLILAALYILAINKREYTNIAFQFYNDLFSDKDVERTLPIRELIVPRAEKLSSLIKRLSPDCYSVFTYKDEGRLIKKPQDIIVSAAKQKGFGLKLYEI